MESYLVELNSYDERFNEVVCNGISEEQVEDLHGKELDSLAEYTLDTQSQDYSFSVCPATSNHINAPFLESKSPK